MLAVDIKFTMDSGKRRRAHPKSACRGFIMAALFPKNFTRQAILPRKNLSQVND